MIQIRCSFAGIVLLEKSGGNEVFTILRRGVLPDFQGNSLCPL
jgi:hypothetical protein